MRSEPVREIFAQCGDAGPRYSLPMLPTIFDAKNAFLHAPLPTGQVVISRTLGSRLNDKMIRRGHSLGKLLFASEASEVSAIWGKIQLFV